MSKTIHRRTFAVTNDRITHQSDTVRRIFDRTLVPSLGALLKAVNEGFEPQKAPFEPLD